MCYYKCYIFLGCGHTVLPREPIRACASAKRERSEELRRRAAGERTTRKRVWNRNQGQSPGGMKAHTASTSNAAGEECEKEDRREKNIPVSTKTELDNARTPPSTTSSPPNQETWPKSCETIKTHPFQTTKIHSPCAKCMHLREALLARSESVTPQVHFEDWRWRVTYLSPPVSSGEARYSGDGILGLGAGVGEAMGSWVKDIGGKGKEVLGGLMQAPTPPRGEEKGKEGA
ncbi:hypothetical protein P280DRAFT_510304 [Massarina eburnea CBS 473.64]|uniref:Uncharacterized protein n=1 Tax=Massarina eburnea CBS 473.64 TaxID=1395130 RepID=A0A6A6RN98_9PLEO|nr:hypothetical protein P280DRAFT_510304 [Massarina eburnea CBS 473.64]